MVAQDGLFFVFAGESAFVVDFQASSFLPAATTFRAQALGGRCKSRAISQGAFIHISRAPSSSSRTGVASGWISLTFRAGVSGEKAKNQVLAYVGNSFGAAVALQLPPCTSKEH